MSISPLFSILTQRFILILIVLLACRTHDLNAQNIPFRNFHKENGLPTNEVYCIEEDSKGYIWFGTEIGAVRYDGKNFVHFGKADGLTDSDIFTIFEDSKERIWFLTYNGRMCYYRDGKFYNPDNDPKLAKIKNIGFASGIMEEEDGTIWISSQSGPVFKITPEEEVEEMSLGPNMYKGIWQRIFHFREIGPDSILGASSGGLFLIDKRTNVCDLLSTFIDASIIRGFNGSKGCLIADINSNLFISKPDSSDPNRVAFHPLPNLPVKSYVNFIREIPESGWFIGTEGGLWISETKDLFSPSWKQVLPGQDITYVKKDRKGNFWITSKSNGVYFASPRAWSARQISIDNGLEITNVSAVGVDKKGNIWAGGEGGRYATLTSEKIVHKSALPKVDSKSGDKIIGFHFLDNGESWLHLPNHLLKKHGEKWETILSINIKGVAFGKSTTYMALSTGGFALSNANIQKDYLNTLEYPIDSSVFKADVLSVELGGEDKVYFGAHEGLFCLEKGTVSPILKGEKVLKEGIKQLKFSPTGGLWMLFKGIGVGIYEEENLAILRTENGLSSSWVTRMAMDSDGNMWVGTSDGLNQISKDQLGNYQILNYHKSDGLPSEYINDIVIKGDSIILATDNGIGIVSRKQLSLPLPAPDITLEEIKIGSDKRDWQETYELGPKENDVSVKVKGFEFEGPGKVEYLYQWGDETQPWTVSESNELNFPDLAPGTYHLTIHAIGVEGRKSDKAIKFTFQIAPPLWQSPWFFVVALVVSLVIITAILIFVIRKVQQREGMKVRLVRAEQKALTAQMNPHFIFNTLNVIKGLYATGRRDPAEKALSKFSGLMRHIMEHSGKEMIPLSDEINLTRTYLELGQLRYPDQVQFSIQIPSDLKLDNFGIPPLLLQPIVENAILHGIVPKNGAGHLELKIQPGDQFIITITDDGIGRAAAAKIQRAQDHTSSALHILRQRIQFFNEGRIDTENRSSINIDDLEDQSGRATGTRVTIFLKPKKIW